MTAKKSLGISFLIGLLTCANLSAGGLLIIPPHASNPIAINHQDIDVLITEQIAITKVNIEFENTSDSSYANCRYMFPLPENTVITNFAIKEDGQVVTGELLTKKEAWEIYLNAVIESGDPALLEYAQSGALTVSIGSIAPNSKKTISVQYAHILESKNRVCEYTYLLSTGKFSAYNIGTLNMDVKINSTSPILNVYSPTHKISINRESEYKVLLSYSEMDSRPNTDFKLFYSISPEDFDLNLLTYRDKGEDGYFTAMLAPQFRIKPTSPVPKDVVFVVDKSGSMGGDKILQAKEALGTFLKNLNVSDKFNIVAFTSETYPLNDSLIPYSYLDVESDSISSFIQGIGAYGMTDINKALLKGLSLINADNAINEDNRPNYIIFLTDGKPTIGITGSKDILDNVSAANTTKTRISVFGIGHGVNTLLLDRISSENNGISVYVDPNENIEVAVSKFFSKNSYPLLTDIKIDFGRILAYDIFPKSLTDLFLGAQLILTGRYKGEGNEIVRLTGNIDSTLKTFDYGAHFPLIQLGYDFVPKLWASKMITSLLDEIRLDDLTDSQKDSIVGQIEDLSFKYGIVTPYTSYLVTPAPPVATRKAAKIKVVSNSPADPLPQSNDKLFDLLSDSVGMSAFATADTMNAWKNSDQVFNYQPSEFNNQAGEMKNVFPKIFITDPNGIFVDQDYNYEDSLVSITFGSGEYIDFLNSHSGICKYLAVGKNLVLVWEKKSYFINDGSFELVVDDSKNVQNNRFGIEAHPNPFNPSTQIHYHTGRKKNGILRIYNISGRLVFSRDIEGRGIIEWDAKGLSSGIYLLKVKTGHKQYSCKLILER